MRIVLDTNVLVSGIFWGGVPEKILSMAMEGHFSLIVTKEIVSEYFRIIDKIGKKDTELTSQWKMLLLQTMTVIDSKIEVRQCRDPKDDMFLECALAGKAKYIVSGDDDLLSIGKIGDVKILTAKEMLQKSGC